MSRKNATARIQSLLPTAIPGAALIPNLTLDSTVLDLRDHLVRALERAGFAPLDSYTFCTRLLQAFCQGGSVSGVALHPPGSLLKKEKGQKRRVQPAMLPTRVRGAEPLLVLVARILVDDGLRNQTPPPDIQISIEQALAICAQTLDALARQPEWKAILLTAPDLRTHRVFELHYATFGYPAYRYFAARMHYGLMARIEDIQRAPEEKREHALRTTITAFYRAIPAYACLFLRIPAEACHVGS